MDQDPRSGTILPPVRLPIDGERRSHRRRDDGVLALLIVASLCAIAAIFLLAWR